MINELLLRVEYNDATYDLIVDNDVPLRIEMSAVETQKLGNFFGIGSQTFNLPGTKETNRFFNYAYDVSTDDVPGFYNTLECSVVLNGETLLIGSLQLVSVITNDEGYVTYQVQVVDKVLQFEQALGSKLIKNADWSAYTHTFGSGSIVDSWSDSLLSGSVYYPLAHYGYPKGDDLPYPQIALTISGSNLGSFINNVFTPMQTQQFLPAIRLKDTLDVIFDQVGFVYTGSFTETEDFQNLYILNKPNEGLGIVATGSVEPTFIATLGSSGTTRYTMETSPNNWDRVQYGSITEDPTGGYTPSCPESATSTNPTGSKFTAPGTGEYTLSANISGFNPLYSTPSVEGVLEITLMKGSLPCGANGGAGTSVATKSITLNSSYGFNTVTLSLEATTTLTQGEDVWIWLEWYATTGTPTSPANDFVLGNYTNTFQCSSGPVSYEGATVNMGLQWQPDTKSLDIVKGLLQQFNLVMVPEVGNKSVIRIEQFDSWIRNGEIKDWTSKYDVAKRIEINHTIDDLEREILLKNADDNDRFSKLAQESAPNYQYGTLRLLADNNISQGEKTIGDYFAPVVLGGQVGYNPGDISEPTTTVDLASNFIYPHLYKLENDKLTSFAFKPRIGYKVNNNLPSGQYLYVGTYGSSELITGSYSTISNVSDLPVIPGVSNDLHFNNTYTPLTGGPFSLNSANNNFDNYWKTYYDSVYWEGSKIVTLDLYFEPYEYKSIQLNDKILIKGQAYRINKISGFNVSHRDVVTVELIKLYPEYWSLPNLPLPTPSATPTGTPTGTPTPTPTPSPTPPDPCICVETGSCTSHTVYPGGGNLNLTCGETSSPIAVYTDNTVWEDSVFLFDDCLTPTTFSLAGSAPFGKNGITLGNISGCPTQIDTYILCASSGSFTYSATLGGICASATTSSLYSTNVFEIRTNSSNLVYSDSGLTTPAADGYYKHGSMILRVISGSTVSADSTVGYCEYPCLFPDVTPTPTPTPTTTPGLTPTPTPSPAPASNNFITSAQYRVPNGQYVQYANYLFIDGMAVPRYQTNSGVLCANSECTVSTSNSWTDGGDGSITVVRTSPSSLAADAGSITISVTAGSATIGGESNPKTFSAGDTINFEWSVTNASSNAVIEIDILEGS